MPRWYEPPRPVAIHLTSAVPPDHLADRLRGAASRRVLSEPFDEGRRVFVLGGRVIGRSVEIRAHPRLVNGGADRRPLDLRAVGAVEPDGTGSRLVGTIQASVRPTMAFLVAFLVGVSAVAVVGGIAWWFVAGLVGAAGICWLAILRGGQRVALRWAPELTAMLQAIAAGTLGHT